MQRFQKLAVGLARTDADTELLRYAAMLVRLGTVTEVRLIHVLPDGPVDVDTERVRGELAAAARAHFTGTPAALTVDVLTGPLLDRLLAFTADHAIDLLVLGHRRSHPGRRALARRLAMKAPCSIWMVPEGSPASLDRILVPVDFSEPAADALRVATSMARLAGHGEVLALNVYFNESTTTYEGYDQVLRSREEEAFRAFVAPIDSQGIRITPVFVEGVNAAAVINRTAEKQGCDLVVMATRGRTRSAAILLGSVTEEAITDTKLPLLVVKHHGAHLGFLRALLEKSLHEHGPKFD